MLIQHLNELDFHVDLFNKSEIGEEEISAAMHWIDRSDDVNVLL